MIKGQAASEQFYNRSGSHATKGSRKGYSILGGGEDVTAHLTPEQQRNNVVTRLKWLRLMLRTTGLTLEEEKEKNTLDKEYRKLHKEIKAKSPSHPDQLFVQVCREIMTPEQFAKIVDLASARRDRLIAEGGL